MLGEVAGYQDEVPAVESLGVADATQDVVVVEAVEHEFADDAGLCRVGAVCDKVHALGEGAGGAHLARNLGDFDAGLFTDAFVPGSIVGDMPLEFEFGREYVPVRAGPYVRRA